MTGDLSAEQLRITYEAELPRYRRFADGLRLLIEKLCLDSKIEIESVQARAKDATSVEEKIRRKAYDDLSMVQDKVGVRVITRYGSDLEAAVKLIGSEFHIQEEVHHGQLDVATFGYSSRHLIIRISEPRSNLPEWKPFCDLLAEVQVRSILQHAWASISHSLDYKSEGDVPPDGRRKLFRVAALLETSDELFDEFRRSVDKARKGYRLDVSRDEWQRLPINIDALREVWLQLPIDQLFNAARASGWRSLPVTQQINAGPKGEVHKARKVWESKASNLVAALNQIEVRTMGELSILIDAAAADSQWLERLSAEAEQGAGKYIPYAVVPDLLLLYIVSRTGNAPLARDISPALVTAALGVHVR